MQNKINGPKLLNIKHLSPFALVAVIVCIRSVYDNIFAINFCVQPGGYMYKGYEMCLSQIYDVFWGT